MVHVNGNSNGEATDQSYTMAYNNSEDLLPHSAMSIGREFVRQYYTMLCNGPNYMHRFYSNNSVFVREGKMFVGQSSIEMFGKEAKQKDTHAKIRAIDAHATFAKGVVVQVIGEVASNKEPFRFFVQTFVLAPHKTPKRYYVHNDTFRFLDDFLTCSNVGTSEISTINETDAERISPNGVADSGGSSISGNPYGDDVTITADASCLYQSANRAPYHDPHSASVSSSECQNFAQQQQPACGDCLSAATVPDLVRDVHSSCDQQESKLSVYDTHNNGCHVPVHDNSGRRSLSDKESIVGGVEDVDEQQGSLNDKQTATWARVASKNAHPVLVIQPSSFIANVQPVAMISPNQAMGVKQSCLENYKQSVNLSMNAGSGGVRGPYDPRASQNLVQAINGHGRAANSFRHQRDNQPMNREYIKEYQVFVGNLPVESKEDEIRSLFAHYGTVTQVSIVCKPLTPPFAFVTFDSMDSVKRTVESASELYIGKNKLSVEKKKGLDGRFQQNLNRGDMNSFQRNNVNSRGGGMSRPPFHHRPNGPFSRGGGGGGPGRTFNNRQPMGGDHVHAFAGSSSVQK